MEEQYHNHTFAMAPGSCACQNSCVNTLVNLARELDELASTQGLAKKSNAGSNKALTEALISPDASTLSFVPPTSKDLFTKFMKVFIEMTQAQDHLEPQKCPLKAKTPEIYFGKSHMDCYYFCQQCEDYFKTSSATGMNHISFAVTFHHGAISLKWA